MLNEFEGRVDEANINSVSDLQKIVNSIESAKKKYFSALNDFSKAIVDYLNKHDEMKDGGYTWVQKTKEWQGGFAEPGKGAYIDIACRQLRALMTVYVSIPGDKNKLQVTVRSENRTKIGEGQLSAQDVGEIIIHYLLH